MANADDSITFVLRELKPIMVRNKNAVNADPKRVAERGDDAAAEYAFQQMNY